MCLIVDANLCSVIFKKTNDKAFLNLRKAIFSSRLTLIHGGKLTSEYQQAGVLDIVASLSRSGRAIRISDELIEKQLALIKDSCTSNDHHVIALARADRLRGRVLCSNDEALRVDFKNKALIDSPRGTIYSPTRHKPSLANC